MPSTRLRNAVAVSFATAAFGAPAATQSGIQEPASTPATPAADPRLEGLPSFLLPVEGGTVTIGMTAEQLIRAACEASFSSRPDVALKTSASAVETAMRRSMQTLGRVTVDVEPFLLAKWPVKNAEYEVFVTESRREGSGLKAVRPPFHWWRYGCPKDYEDKLKEINQRFPGNSDGPLLFWRQEGPSLPYKLVDKDGNSIGDHPVGNVSFIDANEFAAHLGMRLPREAEWMRAARGDRAINWPWGDPQDPSNDKYTGEPALKWLSLYSSKDRAPKPVGTVSNAAGPFGHVDMFGSIWQFVTGPGYNPVNGADEFAAQWKAMQKAKAGELVKAPPVWRNDRVVAKGGSYLSGEDPIQLLIDQRAPMFPDDVLESLGFRLAKSLRPGYDTMFSRLNGVFNRNRFLPEQDVDLPNQIGAERYELGDNGFPTRYQAISFAPVNWLSNDKKARLRDLLEASQSNLLLVGALITTEPLGGHQLPDTLFSVLYRDRGMTKELAEAIKRGYKQVQAELKRAEKAPKGGEAEAPEDDKEAKKDDWSKILQRYGLAREDLEPKGSDKLDFIRIDGIKVPTEEACFLLHNNDGKIVATIPAPNAQPKQSKAFPSEMRLEPDKDGKAVAKFRFGVPLNQFNTDRVIELQMFVTFDTPAPTAEKPWRLPDTN